VESSQYSPWSTPRDSVVSRSGGSIARRHSHRYTSFNEDRINTPETLHEHNAYQLSSRISSRVGSRLTINRTSAIAENSNPASPTAGSELKQNVTDDGRITLSITRPLSPLSIADSQSQSTQDLATFLSSLTHSSEHHTEVTFAEGHQSPIPTADINQDREPSPQQVSRGSVPVAEDEVKDEGSKYPTTWVATTITLGICLVSFATAVDNTIISLLISLNINDIRELHLLIHLLTFQQLPSPV
jgi:hypothetical protein